MQVAHINSYPMEFLITSSKSVKSGAIENYGLACNSQKEFTYDVY